VTDNVDQFCGQQTRSVATQSARVLLASAPPARHDLGMSGQYPPPTPKPPPNQGARLTPRSIAGLVLIVLGLIFIFENTKSVKVRFIIPEVKLPLYFALLCAALLGGLAGMLILWRRGRGDDRR
jgi:uncharacterized integral membrane protein